MITVDINDPNLIENIKAIRALQTFGYCTDEELQRLYDRQVELDKRKDDDNA